MVLDPDKIDKILKNEKKKYTSDERSNIAFAKFFGTLFVGFLVGAFYITFVGNMPIMPDLAYYIIEWDFLPYGYLLYPIPFFPIVSLISYLIYQLLFPHHIHID